jgi:hypothetical protein
LRQSFAVLYTVIDGKIARLTFFPSEDQPSKPPGCGSRAHHPRAGRNARCQSVATLAINAAQIACSCGSWRGASELLVRELHQPARDPHLTTCRVDDDLAHPAGLEDNGWSEAYCPR